MKLLTYVYHIYISYFQKSQHIFLICMFINKKIQTDKQNNYVQLLADFQNTDIMII